MLLLSPQIWSGLVHFLKVNWTNFAGLKWAISSVPLGLQGSLHCLCPSYRYFKKVLEVQGTSSTGTSTVSGDRIWAVGATKGAPIPQCRVLPRVLPTLQSGSLYLSQFLLYSILWRGTPLGRLICDLRQHNFFAFWPLF